MFDYLEQKINTLGLHKLEAFQRDFSYSRGLHVDITVSLYHIDYILHSKEEVNWVLLNFLHNNASYMDITPESIKDRFKTILFFSNVKNEVDTYWATPDQKLKFYIKGNAYPPNRDTIIPIRGGKECVHFRTIYTAFLDKLHDWFVENFDVYYTPHAHSCKFLEDARVVIEYNKCWP